MDCTTCSRGTVPPARAAAGKTDCPKCADRKAAQARAGWCVAPAYNKGAYQLITNPQDLHYTNPKRTT